MTPYRSPHVPPLPPRRWHLREGWLGFIPASLAIAMVGSPFGNEIGSWFTGAHTPWKIQIATAILVAVACWCATFVRYGRDS